MHQVGLSLGESLRAHESFWTKAGGITTLHTWGTDPMVVPDVAGWDYQALAEQARHDISQIEALLRDVLEPGVVAQVLDNKASAGGPLQDELWVRIVYAFAAGARHRRIGVEQLADMFTPLYMWRAAAFASHTALESPVVVQARLDSLCKTFERLKPVLVANWADGSAKT